MIIAQKLQKATALTKVEITKRKENRKHNCYEKFKDFARNDLQDFLMDQNRISTSSCIFLPKKKYFKETKNDINGGEGEQRQ